MDEPREDTVRVIGATVTFVPMEKGAPYSLVEWDADVGVQGPPIHIHHETDEGFYVMAGHFGFVLDGVTTYSKPGSHVLVPKGHAHSFWNAGARPAKCLVILSPPASSGTFASSLRRWAGSTRRRPRLSCESSYRRNTTSRSLARRSDHTSRASAPPRTAAAPRRAARPGW